MSKLDKMRQPIKNNSDVINYEVHKPVDEVQGYFKYLLQWTWWLYITILIMLLIRPFMSLHYQMRRFNIMPLKTISLYLNAYTHIGFYGLVHNLLGNVIIFIPFGFLLPMYYGKGKGFYKITLYTFLLSLAIELWQLTFKVGIFDVDDILLNVIGGVIGYLIFKFFGRNNQEKREI